LKISIITVALNASSTIQDTMGSIDGQSYQNIEHIVVDGKSADDTISIVKKFPHVKKMISEPDRGLYDAMNKGIAMAQGDVIGILNADDLLYEETTIEKIAAVFSSYPEIQLLYGNIEYFRDSNYSEVIRYWRTKNYYPSFFEDGKAPPHPSLFVRAKVYRDIGIYDSSFKIAADYEFMLRAMKIHKLSSFFLDKTLVRMRLGGRSTNGIMSYLKSIKELKRAWRMNNLSTPKALILKRLILRLQQLKVKPINVDLS